MSTLYKRANPLQKKLLKIIEGSVRNAIDAHPEVIADRHTFARSVAKRAVGTITSEWGRLLASGAAKPDVTNGTE